MSDPRDGAASQPAVAISPRDRDLLVAAYRVFAGRRLRQPDRHRRVVRPRAQLGGARRRLGRVRGQPGGRLRRRRRRAAGHERAAGLGGPAPLDAAGEARPAARPHWEAPSALAERRDRRAPGARARRRGAAGLLDAHDRPRRLRAPGRALPALAGRRPDVGGRRPSPRRRRSPNVPYGPYVGGVAVTGRRGGFDVAWVDTSDPSGLDSAWVARTTDGAAWSEPVRAARFRSLPERFAGESFRNVTLLSLAAARGRLYLAYAADVGGQADVQLVHSDAWEQPVTIAADAADQFQPSIAAAGDDVHVSFLDRRLAGAVHRRVAGVLGRPRAHVGARSGSPTTPGIPRSARRTRRPATCWATTRRWPPIAAEPWRWPPTRTWPTRGTATATSTAAPRRSGLPQLFAWTVRAPGVDELADAPERLDHERRRPRAARSSTRSNRSRPRNSVQRSENVPADGIRRTRSAASSPVGLVGPDLDRGW